MIPASLGLGSGGAIGSPLAIEVLREYAGHGVEILRESCWVALQWLE